MKHFVKYLKPYILLCILAPAFKMLEAAFELLVPLLVANIIDEGITNHEKISILTNGALLFGLSAVGFCAAVIAQYFSAKTAMNFGKEVRGVLFRKIQTLSFEDIDNIGTSTLITRMSGDVNQMQNGVNMILRLLLRSPFIVFGATIMAIRLNPKFTGIFLGVLFALFVVVIVIVSFSVALLKMVAKRTDDITLKVREHITGIRVIRAFNKSADEREEFNIAANALVKMQLLVGNLSAFLNPLTLLIVNIGILIIVYSGGMGVTDGSMVKGDVVALYNYMSMILAELIKFVNFVILVSKMFASADRAGQIMQMEPKIVYGKEKTERDENKDKENINRKNEAITANVPLVEFQNVSATYGGDKVIRNIDLFGNKGEIIGIIGGTGAGKSTLVNLIPRFYDVTEGTVRLKGRDVRSYSKKEIGDMVSIALQKSVLFSGSIRENVKLGNETADDELIDIALSMADAKNFVYEKEGNLDYRILADGKNFSGGQRQRLAIARAFAKDSEILILDDSFSALDFATEAKLRNNLNQIKKDKLIFLVSQRISSLKTADRIIVLDKGELVGMGRHEELIENCEIYAEIYNSQGGGATK